MTKQAYSVLVLRPDYLGSDTFYTHVFAKDVADAERKALDKASLTDSAEDYVPPPEDYQVMLVVQGHHPDLKTQY